MNSFPQLSSGSMAQFGIAKRVRLRSEESALGDGTKRRSFDPAGSTVEWEMRLTALSEQERAAIESLFEAREGRRTRFTFLDPTANLLGQTNNLTGELWTVGPGVAVTPVTGPGGVSGGFALSNGSMFWSGVEQSIPSPMGYVYCLSAYVRSGAQGSVRLSIGQSQKEIGVDGAWRQLWFTAPAGSTPVRFAVEAAAGAQLEVYGIQAEAQPAPGPYKLNSGRGGWYPRARFGSDEIAFESVGPGLYEGTITVVSPWEE